MYPRIHKPYCSYSNILNKELKEQEQIGQALARLAKRVLLTDRKTDGQPACCGIKAYNEQI